MKSGEKKMRLVEQSSAASCGRALLLATGLLSSTLSINTNAAEPINIAFPTRYDPATLGEIWFDSFAESTGTQINAFYAQNSVAQLLSMPSDESAMDIVFLSDVDALDACTNGKLISFDHSRLARDDRDRYGDVDDDFLNGGLPPCGVNVFARSTVVAYDLNAFLANRPSSIGSLFDLENFPGTRALVKAPESLIEWALLSYRVPRETVYELLSTERGLKLVFARLDNISDDTIWCDDPAVPAQMLLNSEVVMASGFADSFFDAKTHGNQNVEMLWDGQIVDREQISISSSSNNKESSYQFISFISTSKRLRDYAQRRLVGPMRKSSVDLIRFHKPSNVDIRSQVPTNPVNLERAIFRDVEWYAKTRTRLKALFEEWFKKTRRNLC